MPGGILLTLLLMGETSVWFDPDNKILGKKLFAVFRPIFSKPVMYAHLQHIYQQ